MDQTEKNFTTLEKNLDSFAQTLASHTQKVDGRYKLCHEEIQEKLNKNDAQMKKMFQYSKMKDSAIVDWDLTLLFKFYSDLNHSIKFPLKNIKDLRGEIKHEMNKCYTNELYKTKRDVFMTNSKDICDELKMEFSYIDILSDDVFIENEEHVLSGSSVGYKFSGKSGNKVHIKNAKMEGKDNSTGFEF